MCVSRILREWIKQIALFLNSIKWGKDVDGLLGPCSSFSSPKCLYQCSCLIPGRVILPQISNTEIYDLISKTVRKQLEKFFIKKKHKVLKMAILKYRQKKSYWGCDIILVFSVPRRSVMDQLGQLRFWEIPRNKTALTYSYSLFGANAFKQRKSLHKKIKISIPNQKFSFPRRNRTRFSLNMFVS